MRKHGLKYSNPNAVQLRSFNRTKNLQWKVRLHKRNDNSDGYTYLILVFITGHNHDTLFMFFNDSRTRSNRSKWFKNSTGRDCWTTSTVLVGLQFCYHLLISSSLPSPQLPLTTTFCNMVAKTTDTGFMTGPDISSMWKGMGPTLDVSVPPLIHGQPLGE